MQGNGNEKVYIVDETAALQSRICQKIQYLVQFRSAVLKSQYHFAQSFRIDAASDYLVEIYLFALTIGTNTLKEGIFTDVAAAARAVISAGGEQKLVPAVFAQIFFGFTNSFSAIDADRRPSKLVQALPGKGGNLFYPLWCSF